MKHARSSLVVLLVSLGVGVAVRASEPIALVTPDAVNDALSLRASSIQTLHFAKGPDRRVTTAIDVDGATWTLDLHPNSVRSADFQVLVQFEPDGPLVPVEAPPAQTYKGVVRGMPDTQVRASFIDGKLTATIYVHTGTYAVQPLAGIGFANAGGQHVVYRADDWINTGGYRCGNPGAPVQPGALGRVPAEPEGTGLVVSDLGIDADFEFFVLNQSSVASTVQDIENVINNVEPKYEVPTIGITYEITTLIVRATSADPYTSTNADTLLCEFRNTWNTVPESFIQRDHAHLFTGKILNSPVIGVAYESVVCLLQNFTDCGGAVGKINYGLSESRFTTSFFARVALTSHELGHNWSAVHCDGLGGGCAIMCSSICACAGGCSNFGSSSANLINNFQNSLSCLSGLASPVPLPFFDDFETGGSAVNSTLWSYNNGGFQTTSGVNEPSGVLSLTLDSSGSQLYQDNEIRSNFILLTGQFGARLRYFTEHRGVEAGEELVVEYWKNTRSWVEINRITSDGVTQNNFDFHSHDLPSDALHNEFRVRFRTEGNDAGDDWFIDDVRVTVGCVDSIDCDDSNVCTDDVCDVATGQCTNTPIVCDDANACTDDTCDAVAGCVFTPNSAPCDDGDPCTIADTCAGGACVPGAPLNCDDGDPCTTGDVCLNGSCQIGVPLDCDDNNVCTTDSCVGGICQHANNTLFCSDGDPCTENDVCVVGVCSGTPIVPCLPIEIRLTPVLGTGAGVAIDTTDPLDPEILIDPGEAVLIEAQTLNWDGDLSGSPQLRTIQVDMKTASLTGGTAGALSVLDLDVNNDGICDAAAGLCPICFGSDLRGVYIDACRHRCGGPSGASCDPGDVATCGGDIFACLLAPAGTGFADFFPELPGSGQVTKVTNPNTLVTIVTMQSATGAVNDGETHYVSSFVVTANAAARGTFTLEQYVEGDPASDIGGSFARSSASLPVLPISLGRARITIVEGSCCLPDATCLANVTRPECTASNGLFRPGLACPPPDGTGPPCGVCTSDADCDDSNLCTVEFCCQAIDVPAVPCNLDSCVSKSVFVYGDVNNDTFPSADDVNCLLDAIGGNLPSLACCDRFLGTCSGPGDALPTVDFQKRDVAPCPTPGDPNNMGDGFESADDVNGILDMIGGAVPSSNVGAACLACGAPAPEPPQNRWDQQVSAVDEATLTLVPRPGRVRPGGAIAVDVLIGAVDELRTFQVTLDASGGGRGSLNIESVVIDADRKDFVFGGLETVSVAGAVNRVVLSTLPAGGVRVEKGAYLGTFFLRASADAGGTFTVRIHDDGRTLLRTSLNEVITVNAVPTRIVVGSGR